MTVPVNISVLVPVYNVDRTWFSAWKAFALRRFVNWR